MLKCDLKSCFEHWPPQLKLRISYLLVILFRNAWNEWSTFSTIVNAGLLLGKENFDKCSHLAACSRRLSCPASRGLPRSPWALLPHHIPGWWPCCCCEGRLPKDNCKKNRVCQTTWSQLNSWQVENRGLHSLFFDLIGSSARHLPRVHLRLAAMPQVDEGLADAQQHHGDSWAQAAAVTGDLQQMALYLHLPTHTVQTPIIWDKEGRWTEVNEMAKLFGGV